MKIIIAGGGIAGLTAALCLARDNHSVCVLEQAPALTEVGAGLQLSPNGMRVLEHLGLAERVKAVGFEPKGIELRMGQRGRVIFDIPLAEYAERRWGAPYIHIHRADLLDVLAEAAGALPNIEFRLETQLQSVTERPDGVEVSLSGGRTETGDLLVGADGIHSVVREHLLGPVQPRFTGCVAWRGVIEADKLGEFRPPQTACAWVGKGAHAVTYYLRGGKLVNLVGVIERSDWRTESWSEEGQMAEFAADFEGWHPVITNFIQSGEQFFRWALFDRPPLRKWISKRIAIMGDAAHPMLPFLAQGAVMAIEDAAVLAKSLRNHSGLSEALDSYQARRHSRTAQVQLQSRRNAKTFHRRTPVTRLATYGPMWLAGHVAPEIVHRRMDWIYAHNPLE